MDDFLLLMQPQQLPLYIFFRQVKSKLRLPYPYRASIKLTNQTKVCVFNGALEEYRQIVVQRFCLCFDLHSAMDH